MIEIYAYLKIILLDSNLTQYSEDLKKLLIFFFKIEEENPDIFLKYLSSNCPAALAFLKDHRLMITDKKKEIISLKLKNIETVLFGELIYPTLFYQMENPPWFFQYWGHPAWMSSRTLSVVGSRNPHALSLQWMEEELQPAIVKNQIITVSGGARGVDQKAHSISVRNQLPTIAVLPSGFGNVYPSDFKPMARLIKENGGCLVTEYEYNQPMRKYFFPQRNRLIVGFSQSTCIVEAKRRSGTYLSAQIAASMGRSLYVLPSHPSLAQFAGNLDLIMEGASPIRNSEDLLGYFEADSNSYL